MSTRFKWLAIVAYGGMAVSTLALVLLILGFGQVGQCSTVDNTWEECSFRTELLGQLLVPPMLASVVASLVAAFTRPKPGESGKWGAASSVFVAPLLLGLLLLLLVNLEVR